MIEVIIGIFVGLWAFGKVTTRAGGKNLSNATTNKALRVLNIPESVFYAGSRAFIKGFGIRPSDVADVRYFPGACSVDELPVPIRGCVEKLYLEGDSRGVEVPGLLYRKEDVKPGWAIYFALVAPEGVNPYVVTFVDRLYSS